MAIVKQLSFKEKEKALFEYANDRGNFSEYIKQLIKADMAEEAPIREKGVAHIRESNVVMQHKEQQEEKQSEFVIEAERDDLEI